MPPTFSKVDLISCRNLLIYMGGELQQKIIPLFHYALNPGGFLFLSTSETVGVFSDLFAALDRKLKLFHRKEELPGVERPVKYRIFPLGLNEGTFPQAVGKAPGESKLPLRELTERALLQQYTLENVIEGAVITFAEITLLKRTEAALRDYEVFRRLAVLVRDSRDAITMQDFGGRILAWNPAAERMYGWTEAEALNMNIRELVPEGRREEALTLMRRLSRAEVLEPGRAERLAKDGQSVAVWLTATALVNECGAPCSHLVFKRAFDPKVDGP